jgi:hypothetical protein
MDDPLECKHTMFKDAIVSTSDAQKVLDEMPSVVLWDEDRPPELHMNSDLLQRLAQGGQDLIDEENKPTTKLFFIDESTTLPLSQGLPMILLMRFSQKGLLRW